MAEKIRWGILSTGNIAHQFARGLAATSDAELVAVGSRKVESARKFADEFKVPRAHGSYEDLAADPQVDAIYVSTPHPFHKENTIACLEAGKAVLCEKPFAINRSETQEMIETARRKKRPLLEAMWTRFLPATRRVLELLREGAIGEVKMLRCDFGFRAPFNPASRLFAPELGGGALLDVGVYTLSFSSMVFGKPQKAVGLTHLGSTGVDEVSGYVLSHAGGALSVMATAVALNMSTEAEFFGTEGRLRVGPPFFKAEKLLLTRYGKEPEEIALPLEGNGYNYQAVEMGRLIREGKLESDLLPWSETLSIMETMDDLRAQWNFRYPMEK